jgi:hypothetical protein
MKIKIYDLVLELLQDYPESRNSDKKLIWRAWEKLGYVESGYSLQYEDFMRAPSTESLRRARQLVQASHPELQATRRVRSERKFIENQKGTFVYREVTPVQERFL